ncbi:MAG: hypothetical protein ISS47_02985 [Candidatus Omnitrophica bacterium]|nr:hypothetical protein [Candidatus Omnitrophota bacterium]
MTKRQSEVAILYSGGTDSTCAAAIMAERFEVIHLLTIDRLGFYSVENTKRNVDLLRKTFPHTVFKHKIVNVDRLARYVSYHNFMRELFRYSFFVLSNCILCCLINHFAALLYCLENNINNVADGVTREWPYFPSHMEKVVSLFKEMYASFGIVYDTPVYDFDVLPPPRLIDKIHPIKSIDLKEHASDAKKNTTGNYLFERGIFSSSNLKGTDADHKMQPRCFQFILHHIYIFWYFMHRYNYSDFESITLRFLQQKINAFVELVESRREIVKKLKNVRDATVEGNEIIRTA